MTEQILTHNRLELKMWIKFKKKKKHSLTGLSISMHIKKKKTFVHRLIK